MTKDDNDSDMPDEYYTDKTETTLDTTLPVLEVEVEWMNGDTETILCTEVDECDGRLCIYKNDTDDLKLGFTGGWNRSSTTPVFNKQTNYCEDADVTIPLDSVKKYSYEEVDTRRFEVDVIYMIRHYDGGEKETGEYIAQKPIKEVEDDDGS